MVKQAMPTLDVDQLADELRSLASMNDLGAPGFDLLFGHGLARFTSGPPGPLTLSGLTFCDDAMTNPVSNLASVEVFNLDRGLEFQALTALQSSCSPTTTGFAAALSRRFRGSHCR